jgi:predicted unusual protein kinase regulating ubiquinone biosynthesis (AarF/ABC1/UbiB family)
VSGGDAEDDGRRGADPARARDLRAAARGERWARLWARARQVLTTDPTGTEADAAVAAEAGARAQARSAAALKGGLAKVAQLGAYAGGVADEALAPLWDQAPPAPASAIAAVVRAELGRTPQQLFSTWSATPLAAASLGQVHAATDADGTAWAVKVQYPGIAEALRADLGDRELARKLAGGALVGVGRDALGALIDAVLAETDYLREADALERFAAAWADDPQVHLPAVDRARTSRRVLTMQRARGVPWRQLAAAPAAVRAAAAAVVVRVAWGSPWRHGWFNADPNPGNYLVEVEADPTAVWFLDFGCAVELDAASREADRTMWRGLVDPDPFAGAERMRTAAHQLGLVGRTDALGGDAFRAWERALAAPLASPTFTWTHAYATDLAAAFARVIATGAVTVPAPLLLLWRQRLGVAAVLGLVEPTLDLRGELRRLLGERHALR